MQVTVDIPDALAEQLIPKGQQPSRALLEDALVQAYREERITSGQLMEALGIETRYELDGFLKPRNVFEGAYGAAELKEDLATMDALALKLNSTLRL